MKKLLFTLVLMLCLGTSTAFAATEYAYQSFWSAQHHLNKEIIEPWCEGFKQATNGAMILHFNGNTALVSTASAGPAIQKGSIDGGGIQLQTAMSMMPLSQLLALPFLVQDAIEACTLAYKMYETFPEIQQEINKNFKFVTTVGSDRYAFVASKSLIRTPADLAGKRVLIWSPAQIEEVKAWGGLPVQIASTETYLGLQRGLGEVAYVPAPTIEGGKLAEVAKYITLLPVRSLPMIIAFNHDSYEEFPDSAKKYIEETGGKVLSEKIGQALVRLTEEDNEKHLAKGCTLHVLTLEEQKMFREAADAANRKYWVEMLTRNKVKNPDEWIDNVYKLAAETFNR